MNQRINDAIDEEFAFHIAQLEAELRAQGHAEELIAQEVRRRFGDPAKLRKQCQSIAMKEHMMLQKINLAMLVVLVIAVAALAMMLVNSNRRSGERIDELMSQLQTVSERTTAASRRWALAASKETKDTPGVIYVEGQVDRPGVYNMPTHRILTVSRLIAASGGKLDRTDLRVTVQRLDESHGERAIVFSADFAELASNPSHDFELVADDLVRVVSAQ